jgi:hypothetical protein
MIWLLAALGACTGKDGAESVDSAHETAVDSAGDSGGDSDSDSGGETGEVPCNDTAIPAPDILTPADDATIAVGSDVALSGVYPGLGLHSVTWLVDGVVVATGTTETGFGATWPAAPLGDHTVTLDVDASCGAGTASAAFHVVDEAQPSVTSWDSASGLPLASWYGLSVAPDGTVWGATSSGLLHFDPVAGTVRTYRSADGLYTDYPRSVLAASDGTIWVGNGGSPLAAVTLSRVSR